MFHFCLRSSLLLALLLRLPDIASLSKQSFIQPLRRYDRPPPKDEKLESMSLMNGNALSNTTTLDAELLEELYLSPKNAVAGVLRKTFDYPIPVDGRTFPLQFVNLVANMA